MDSKLREKISKTEEFKNMDVSSLLMSPIQRIPRYKLLTEAALDVLKHIADNNKVIENGKKVKKLLEDVSILKFIF